AVAIEGTDARELSLTRANDGYWSGHVDGVRAGARYRYLLRGQRYPDPCSRFQPEGPHGPSLVVDEQGGTVRAFRLEARARIRVALSAQEVTVAGAGANAVDVPTPVAVVGARERKLARIRSLDRNG